jgi:AcrR family transcriptional regulator
MATADRRPATRNPRGQGDLLRERLVDAALASIDERGDASGISIRSVTKGAGVSPTAFYLHFENREELLAACVERSFAEFRDAMRAAVAQAAGPWDQLIRAGLAYMDFARTRPARYLLIFGAPTREPGLSGMEPLPKPAAGTDAFEDLVGLIADYLGPDDPRREEAETLAKGIWSGLHGFVTLRHSRPGMTWPPDEEFARRLAEAWLGGRR